MARASARRRRMAGRARILAGGLMLSALLAGAAETASAQDDGAQDPAAGRCGTVDLVLVFDKTYSLRTAITEAKREAHRLLDLVSLVSRGQFRLGLISFRDDIDVDLDLGTHERPEAAEAAFRRALAGLEAHGGQGGPEASDEALRTAVEGIPGGGNRPQRGDFTAAWEAHSRILVLVTDNLPGGFDDTFTPGEDDRRARAIADRARDRDIRISSIYIPTTGGYTEPADPRKAEIMRSYAQLTGGIYAETQESGAGAAEAIARIVRACGAKRIS